MNSLLEKADMELNRLELLAEDLECTHMWLDDLGTPRHEGDKEFSLVGRVRIAMRRIEPTHEVADAFWKSWDENGKTHKHGYYESTWIAINAALAEWVESFD